MCKRQGRNHVFQSWGSNSLVYVILPFYRKKLDRSTQFGAVGYIITLYSSKSYVKKLGVCPKFGEVRTPPPIPSGCAHGNRTRQTARTFVVFVRPFVFDIVSVVSTAPWSRQVITAVRNRHPWSRPVNKGAKSKFTGGDNHGRNHWVSRGGPDLPKIWTDPPTFYIAFWWIECDYVTDCTKLGRPV